MFCRCEIGFGGGENTQTCPVCLGIPGALPVPNRDGDRVDDQARARARLRDRAARASSRRKNYFYPDLPKGYQISQYDYRLHRRQVLVPTPDGDHEVGIVRAHLEEDAAKTTHVGGAHRPDRRRRPLARRLQPRRHAARRDRHRPRHPLGRGRAALPAAAAADDRRARDLRRGDGEGHAARRRQRLRPAARVDGAAHALRAEEHELVQLRRARDRRRGRAADRASTSRGGEVVQETYDFDAATRHADRRTARRRRPTTTATSPSPTSCRSSRRPSSSSGCAPSCRSCPARGSAGSRPSSTSTSPTGSSRAAATGSTGDGRARAPSRAARRTSS